MRTCSFAYARGRVPGTLVLSLLLYYIIDVVFNFLILLKTINYLGRYAAPKLHFLHPAILFPVWGMARKYVTRGGSKFE